MRDTNEEIGFSSLGCRLYEAVELQKLAVRSNQVRQRKQEAAVLLLSIAHVHKLQALTTRPRLSADNVDSADRKTPFLKSVA